MSGLLFTGVGSSAAASAQLRLQHSAAGIANIQDAIDAPNTPVQHVQAIPTFQVISAESVGHVSWDLSMCGHHMRVGHCEVANGLLRRACACLQSGLDKLQGQAMQEQCSMFCQQLQLGRKLQNPFSVRSLDLLPALLVVRIEIKAMQFHCVHAFGQRLRQCSSQLKTIPGSALRAAIVAHNHEKWSGHFASVKVTAHHPAGGDGLALAADTITSAG